MDDLPRAVHAYKAAAEKKRSTGEAVKKNFICSCLTVQKYQHAAVTRRADVCIVFVAGECRIIVQAAVQDDNLNGYVGDEDARENRIKRRGQVDQRELEIGSRMEMKSDMSNGERKQRRRRCER